MTYGRRTFFEILTWRMHASEEDIWGFVAEFSIAAAKVVVSEFLNFVSPKVNWGMIDAECRDLPFIC